MKATRYVTIFLLFLAFYKDSFAKSVSLERLNCELGITDLAASPSNSSPPQVLIDYILTRDPSDPKRTQSYDHIHGAQITDKFAFLWVARTHSNPMRAQRGGPDLPMTDFRRQTHFLFRLDRSTGIIDRAVMGSAVSAFKVIDDALYIVDYDIPLSGFPSVERIDLHRLNPQGLGRMLRDDSESIVRRESYPWAFDKSGPVLWSKRIISFEVRWEEVLVVRAGNEAQETLPKRRPQVRPSWD